jgi:hypothetical protein
MVFETRGKNPFVKISKHFTLTFSMPNQILKECDYRTKRRSKGTRDMAEVLKLYFISTFMVLSINFKLSRHV